MAMCMNTSNVLLLLFTRYYEYNGGAYYIKINACRPNIASNWTDSSVILLNFEHDYW